MAQISAERQRRSRRWRLAFLATWAVIVAGLVLFILVTVNVDTAFLQQTIPFILAGVPITLFLAITSIFFATILAGLGALGRLSRNPYLNGIASFYVSFFRGTPLLLQILFIYLALPQAGIVLPAVPTAIVALSLNYGSYMTEVFRSGIEAVPHGQTEAAQSLGMNSRTTFRRIIAPQAFRIVTPAVGNDFISMIKDSSLASVVGVQEILWRAQGGPPGLPVDADAAGGRVHLLGSHDPLLALPEPPRAAHGDRRPEPGASTVTPPSVARPCHRPGRDAGPHVKPAPSRSSRPVIEKNFDTTTSCVGAR